MTDKRGDWKAVSGLVHPYERNARRERDQGLRVWGQANPAATRDDTPRTRIKYILHGYQVQVYVPRKEQQP